MFGSYILLKYELVTKISKTEVLESPYKQKLEDVFMQEFDQQKLKYSIKASEAIDPRETTKWNLINVDVNFYSTKDDYRILGDKALVDVETKDMEIIGNVSVRTKSGYFFKSKSMTYNNEKKMLTSKSKVTLKSELKNSTYLESGSMKILFDSDEIFLKNNTTVKQVLKNKQTVVVNGNEATINKSTGKTDFFGDVKINYGGILIKGPEAKFQFDAKKFKITNIVIDNGVELNDRKREVKALSMNFNTVTDQILFKGNPVVKQGSDILFGNEIIIKNKGKDLEVKNVKANVRSNEYGK
jgi:LPS export ABC transporter protein LptC